MTGKIKLLIVDDEVQFLNSIAQRLELRGFEVAKAVNGLEAVDITRREKFDLALLDLKMPGMDGREVLGSFESAVECTRLGAYSYLPKPYELDKLIDLMKDAYQARMEKIMSAATGESALGILRRLREVDDEEK